MSKAKILIYDIETAPNLAYVWGKWQQDVIEFENDWYILCYAYKWYGDKKATAVTLPEFVSYKKDKEDDQYLVKTLHKLFDMADIVIAHNGDRFDQRKVHARMIIHGMDPPSPYESIDTLKVARKYFKFDSNRLDDLGKQLGVGRKVKTGGFDLWMQCMNGDEKAWAKMAKYNRQDVDLLEQVYEKMRPWIHNHPNVSQYKGLLDGCPKCGSKKLLGNGKRRTRANWYQRYQCQDCGGYSQARMPKDADRQSIVN